MDKAVFEKILTAQDEIHNNPEYKHLLAKCEQLHARF